MCHTTTNKWPAGYYDVEANHKYVERPSLHRLVIDRPFTTEEALKILRESDSSIISIQAPYRVR